MNHKPIKKTHFTLTFKRTFLASLLLLPITLQAQPQTVKEKASYAIAVNFVNSIKMQGIELDQKSVAQGVDDAFSGKVSYSVEEMQQALDTFKTQLIEEQKKVQQEQSGKNKQLGDAFLAENKTKEGVVTLESGLQYKVITSGNGPSPKLTDKVTTHYRGTLIDGTEFDSSYSRNKPTSFPVNGVIPGWTEALQLMHQGDKWQLFVPANLAYGERAVGNVIQPNSTLVFEIELLKIN